MNGTGERCRTFHTIHSLSFFTATSSVILLIATVSMNGVIILVCIKNGKLLHKSMFYKMLLNISIADFLTGFISDTTSISFHTKEWLEKHISHGEVVLLHCGLFFINSASVLTMAILCIDRVILLVWPLIFRKGLVYWQCIGILLSTWFLAALLIIPYFFIGYIRYLQIFSFATVGVTCICLVIVTITYRKNLVLFYSSQNLRGSVKTEKRERFYTQQSVVDIEETSSASKDECFEDSKAMKIYDNAHDEIREKNGYSVEYEKARNKKLLSEKIIVKRKRDSPRPSVRRSMRSVSNESTSNTSDSSRSDHRYLNRKNSSIQSWHGESARCKASERRVNKTFIVMLIVYLGTYLPSAVMTAYVNICVQCNCVLIHSMRDLIYLSILSSAVWRPLNFIYRLQTLKNEIKLLFYPVAVCEQDQSSIG